mgnify:CR=1 FL=1
MLPYIFATFFGAMLTFSTCSFDSQCGHEILCRLCTGRWHQRKRPLGCVIGETYLSGHNALLGNNTSTCSYDRHHNRVHIECSRGIRVCASCGRACIVHWHGPTFPHGFGNDEHSILFYAPHWHRDECYGIRHRISSCQTHGQTWDLSQDPCHHFAFHSYANPRFVFPHSSFSRSFSFLTGDRFAVWPTFAF